VSGRDRAEGKEVMVGSRSGRFSYKQERELISMAANRATISQIAARFKTTAETIERKAKRLGISVRKDRVPSTR
jgi:hypothetical protein